MKALLKHWPRITVTLIPLVFALLHTLGIVQLDFLLRLDDIIYDTRLNATMPRTLDERIVIVDVDEKSLAEVGRWPWSRNKLARLTDELFSRHQIRLLGYDMVFAEADESSGLTHLRQLARDELRDHAGFADTVTKLQSSLDYDALFAQSLENRPVALGYYFTNLGTTESRTSGVLPAPVMQRNALQGRPVAFTHWNGFGASIAPLAQAAPVGGFMNPNVDIDGVVRSEPLLSEYKGHYYESLALAMFRLLLGSPTIAPGFPQEKLALRTHRWLDSILLQQGTTTLAVPVDDRVSTLVPFRGKGGQAGGSFRYISASDVLSQRVPTDALKGKIVLVGTTAPGLYDLRVTPVGEVYPGVETHANIISGLLDGKVLVKPDYAVTFDMVLLLAAGLLLALALPLLSAPRAVALNLAVIAALVGINFWLYLGSGLVLPLATALVMAMSAFALNMSYGYFVESKSKRDLANLFGTYVPPELVDEMVKDAGSYGMQATNKELTVMFCDMRGFTKLSENMEPTQLQALLNRVFSRLTDIIRSNRGTIDKYMGDCVMAFWGAPVDTPQHAALAVKTAFEMNLAVQAINAEHRAQGLPDIGVGIGLNTGIMCVGDMGSSVRRSYTVIGDAVNLGSRLEGLCKNYGVDMIVSESTRMQAPAFVWQELDTVRVKGKEQAVTIYQALAPLGQASPAQATELGIWNLMLNAYIHQNWDACDAHLQQLAQLNAKNYLYQLYAQRVASMRLQPSDPAWDGATRF
jgi:adenylate cyclase